MATLSCAMVGPMDGIYLINASRVMRSCSKDGVVLKPDRPLTTTDACFKSTGINQPTCHIYHTYSDHVAAAVRVHYVFSNDVVPITPDIVYMNSASQVRLFVFVDHACMHFSLSVVDLLVVCKGWWKTYYFES